jgi:hypothetical protein
MSLIGKASQAGTTQEDLYLKGEGVILQGEQKAVLCHLGESKEDLEWRLLAAKVPAFQRGAIHSSVEADKRKCDLQERLKKKLLIRKAGEDGDAVREALQDYKIVERVVHREEHFMVLEHGDRYESTFFLPPLSDKVSAQLQRVFPDIRAGTSPSKMIGDKGPIAGDCTLEQRIEENRKIAALALRLWEKEMKKEVLTWLQG